MKLTIYQVDAFTDTVFKGNPAAVCLLPAWLSDEILLKIAQENNLSETAFCVPKDDFFEIRWFTPAAEVDLCGHATLAAAFIIYCYENYEKQCIHFCSVRSGDLYVNREINLLVLNFPTDEFVEIALTSELVSATDKMPIAAYKGKTDYMLVFENEEQIATMQPNLTLIRSLEARGLIVTARSERYDFVSRFFGPAVGINEDPVTGSAHTTLVPYWSKQLNSNELSAYQLSERGGELHCRFLGNRIEIGGAAVLYMKGEIFI
ncbi:PhzF family phenazine biosynthesis protein [Sphingobacterium sp. LRF_L2]|uniref:PhzF family phenazine biosynthesis protein n=1 Tax=Sphingobacterium sp. LRF_L2 TaxID=3369421 RepID=UPI003F5E9152